MKNPFHVGIKDSFWDGAEEKKAILKHIRNREDVVLVSPRGYGKTTLVHKVLQTLEHQGFFTVYVDVSLVISCRNFAERFAASVLRAEIHNSDPATCDGVFLFLNYLFENKDASDKKTDMALLVNLIRSIHGYLQKKKMLVCIVFDEFFDLEKLKECKKIEYLVLSQGKPNKVSCIYMGSKRNTILNMIQADRRLYKKAVLYELKAVPKKKAVYYIISKFKTGGKVCTPEAAEEIYNKVRGQPYYIQRLASVAWELTDKKCDVGAVLLAYYQLVKSEASFRVIWKGLTLTQKLILKELAKDPSASPYSKDFLEKFQLSKGSVQRAIDRLLYEDLIEKNKDSRYAITNPIYEGRLKYF